MMARILFILLLANVAFGTEARELMTVAESPGEPHIVVRNHPAAQDSAMIEFTLGDGPGRFAIPIDNSLAGTGSDQRVLSFETSWGRHRVFPATATNLEWELTLETAPVSNRIDFPVISDSLLYYYQPPLSVAELADGAERADSVIGSYAVYHAPDRCGRSAKAFHIFRPRAWDSGGDTVWCALTIQPDLGRLIVDIPPHFLLAARYPVTVDPTFGFSAMGASSAPMANTVCYANVYDTHTAASGDRVVQFHAYLRGVGDGAIDLAVYNVTGGVPDTRLATPITLTVPGSGEIVLHSSLPVSQGLVGGDIYGVAMGREVGDIRYAYDVVSSGLSVHTASGVLPATWSHGAVSDRRLSIYVTYEENQATAILSPRRRKLTAAER